MKRTLLFFAGFLLTLAFLPNSFAQTPQYYNANSGGIGNTLPFGSLAISGYKTQWLIGPGEYTQPSPAPIGSITKFYINMNTTGGPATYTNLAIKMWQTSITSFTGEYTGLLDTVFFRSSIQLSSVANTWLSFTLDKTFFYNPAQSLIIQVSHCGFSGTGMNIWQSAGTTGIFRRNNIPGTTSCVFTYSSQDTRILQNGLDIIPATIRCRNGLNIPIPQVGSIVDSVQVALGGCTVADVDVVIDTLIHTWLSDLKIYIRKASVGVLIANQIGGSGDNFIGTIFDDEAFVITPPPPPPFTGRFRPSFPLTPFDGQLTDGYWRLHITDTVAGDSGFLRAWCVAVSYICPVGGIQTVEIPNHYRLSQNYPNPFNPTTTIKFGMPRGEKVKLVIYDMLGREVKVLVDEFKNSGTYEVSFDASSLSSGVYFYKLETPNFAATKKMLLVK